MQSDRSAKSPAIRVTALKIQVFQAQTDELCPEALSGRLPQSAGILLTPTPQQNFALLCWGSEKLGTTFSLAQSCHGTCL